MSVAYRSIISTEKPAGEALPVLTTAWYRWMEDKYPEAQLPGEDGNTQFTQKGDTVTVGVRRSGDGGHLHMELAHRSGPRVWTTSVHSGPQPTGTGQWIVTETSVTGGLPPGALPAAPRFMPSVVTDLRAAAGGLPLMSHGVTPLRTDAEITLLGQLLTSPQRRHGVVVAVDDCHSRGIARCAGTSLTDVLQRTYRTIAGAADVFVITDTGAKALYRYLGRGVSVHNGAARVYLPDVIPEDRFDADRHRYTTPDNYLSHDFGLLPRLAASRIMAYTAGLPAPANYTDHLAALRQGPATAPAADTVPADTAEADELRELAIETAERAEAQRDVAIAAQQRLELRLTESQLNELGLVDEISAGTHREQALAADNRRLRMLLHTAGITDTVDIPRCDPVPESATDTTGTDDSDMVSIASIADAIGYGQTLPWLAWGEDAPQQVGRMDTSPSAPAWGQRTWEAFQALNAYCEAVNEEGWNTGGFWEWLTCSGSQFVVPAGKVSMSESDTVANHRRYSKARRFSLPVPWAWSEPTAVVLSHMKPIKGGGSLIPRVYFDLRPYPMSADGRQLPDPSRKGKLHALITFVGPHFLVPNTRT